MDLYLLLKKIGKHATKVTINIGKNISNKYSQKLVDSAKKSARDAKKLPQNKQFQKQLRHLEI